MKKFILSAVLIMTWVFTYAQPSNGAVIQKIKERYSGGKTPVIKIGKTSSTKEFKRGKWYYYYWHHYTVTAKAKKNNTAIKKVVL